MTGNLSDTAEHHHHVNTMASGVPPTPPDDLTIAVDPEALLAFADRLEARASDLEDGLAVERQKVESAVKRAGSMYTKDSMVAPVFRPMGSALDTVLDKAEENVAALTATLRNDASLLREYVAAHEEAERRAARGFDGVGWDAPERQPKGSVPSEVRVV